MSGPRRAAPPQSGGGVGRRGPGPVVARPLARPQCRPARRSASTFGHVPRRVEGSRRAPAQGGVAPESRDPRYVTAIRAPCSLVCHHPYQNYLQPVRQNRFTPHQTPFRRCRYPTWAGLAPRRRRVARRVADRLATRGRGGARAGRPRLALDRKVFRNRVFRVLGLVLSSLNL